MKYKRKEIIGDCVLYLGDCKEILPTLDGVETLISDPPYGMAFNSNHREAKHTEIANDKTPEYLLWACEIKASHSKYLFCRWDNLKDVPPPKSCITWIKNNWSMGDLNHEHARQTEIILFYREEGHFFPSGRPTDIVYGSRTGNNLHPTQKPVDLMRNIIGWTDGVVTDAFMGSGTTGVACAKLGRKFIGIELDEKYFDIACRRIEEAYKQPDMFIERPPEPIQEELI